MRIYYAHCLAIYNTHQEHRDLATLRALGFEVLNPNQAHIARTVAELKAKNDPNYMEYFNGLISTCQAFAFRALPGWGAMIPAGVAKELEFARSIGLPIIELPGAPEHRTMTLEATRAYLAECGQR